MNSEIKDPSGDARTLAASSRMVEIEGPRDSQKRPIDRIREPINSPCSALRFLFAVDLHRSWMLVDGKIRETTKRNFCTTESRVNRGKLANIFLPIRCARTCIPSRNRETCEGRLDVRNRHGPRGGAHETCLRKVKLCLFIFDLVNHPRGPVRFSDKVKLTVSPGSFDDVRDVHDEENTPK